MKNEYSGDFPKSREEENELVLDNNTTSLLDYMIILIDKVLSRFSMSSQTYGYLEKHLEDDVLVARRRFIDNKNYEDKDTKFSTYFTWYIHKLLESRDDIKEKQGE